MPVGPYSDRNLSRLLQLLRRLPLLPACPYRSAPADCARQLAAVAVRLAQQLSRCECDPKPDRIPPVAT